MTQSIQGGTKQPVTLSHILAIKLKNTESTSHSFIQKIAEIIAILLVKAYDHKEITQDDYNLFKIFNDVSLSKLRNQPSTARNILFNSKNISIKLDQLNLTITLDNKQLYKKTFRNEDEFHRWHINVMASIVKYEAEQFISQNLPTYPTRHDYISRTVTLLLTSMVPSELAKSLDTIAKDLATKIIEDERYNLIDPGALINNTQSIAEATIINKEKAKLTIKGNHPTESKPTSKRILTFTYIKDDHPRYEIDIINYSRIPSKIPETNCAWNAKPHQQ